MTSETREQLNGITDTDDVTSKASNHQQIQERRHGLLRATMQNVAFFSPSCLVSLLVLRGFFIILAALVYVSLVMLGEGRRKKIEKDLRCMRPSRLRISVCRWQPSPRRGLAACRSGPSIALRGPCQLGLHGQVSLFSVSLYISLLMKTREKNDDLPKVMFGFSSRTAARCSLAKIM